MRKTHFIQTIFYMLLYSACVIFSSTLYAQTAADNLGSKLSNIKTFQANFSQTVEDKNGNALQQSHGKMALMRPGLFRWETLSPNQQLIIADGKTIWIIDKDLAQVTKQKQNSANNAPGLLLSDSVNHIVSQFTIISENKENSLFKLIPKGKKDLFQSIELFFNNNNLSKMVLYDGLGQITVITFMQNQNNTNISRQLFVYSPPRNIDITG